MALGIGTAIVLGVTTIGGLWMVKENIKEVKKPSPPPSQGSFEDTANDLANNLPVLGASAVLVTTGIYLMKKGK